MAAIPAAAANSTQTFQGPGGAAAAQSDQGTPETRTALAQALGIPPEQAAQLATDPTKFQAAIAEKF